MQRIANLLAVQNDQVLLLQKPRRGWYVAPGGKMESGESIYEAAIREFQEETNVTPQNVHLKGVYTMIIKNGEQKKFEEAFIEELESEIQKFKTEYNPQNITYDVTFNGKEDVHIVYHIDNISEEYENKNSTKARQSLRTR